MTDRTYQTVQKINIAQRIYQKMQKIHRWQKITGLALLAAAGVGIYFAYTHSNRKPVENKIEIVERSDKDSKKESVISEDSNFTGRVGLEGDIRCYQGNNEIDMKRTLSSDDTRDISYDKFSVYTGARYSCIPAVRGEWFGSDTEHNGKKYDVKMFAISEADELYPVHGFRADRTSIKFLFDKPYAGKYRLEIPVFGCKFDENGSKVCDKFIGQRTLDFIVQNKSAQDYVTTNTEDSAPRSEYKTDPLDPFGSVMEAGR